MELVHSGHLLKSVLILKEERERRGINSLFDGARLLRGRLGLASERSMCPAQIRNITSVGILGESASQLPKKPLSIIHNNITYMKNYRYIH